MRLRRITRPARASRDSVAVAGSGTAGAIGAVYALVILMDVCAFGMDAAPVLVSVAKLNEPTILLSLIENLISLSAVLVTVNRFEPLYVRTIPRVSGETVSALEPVFNAGTLLASTPVSFDSDEPYDHLLIPTTTRSELLSEPKYIRKLSSAFSAVVL